MFRQEGGEGGREKLLIGENKHCELDAVLVCRRSEDHLPFQLLLHIIQLQVSKNLSGSFCRRTFGTALSHLEDL